MLSPYPVKGNFEKEMKNLTEKYGLNQIFVCYSEPENSEESKWFGLSNNISDGMIEYLEITVEDMKERLADR